MSCYFTNKFAHLLTFAAVGYSIVYKYIGWELQGLTYSRFTAKIVEKGVKYAQSLQ